MTINLEKLLGRAPVQVDTRVALPVIRNRTVLVTGAAGSIGSELCHQAISFCPKKLVCVDHNETGVFYLQRDLEKLTADTSIKVRHHITDICDSEEIKRIYRTELPNVILHAAALKHGPLIESHPREAVRSNIFALIGLLDAAERSGCESFLFVSTDKAVYPSGIMGATKRVGELILSSRPSSMRCVSVRFGNVLGSNGSVVPLLQEQIRAATELTITHPDVSRFFMTIQEAVSLVLQGLAVGEHGEILVLDMGEPVRILDLAKLLIRLSGKTHDDVRIRFCGLRAGEKLHEELFYPYESVGPTSCPKIRCARGPVYSWSMIQNQLVELQQCLADGDDRRLRVVLNSAVSTCSLGSPFLLQPANDAASQPAPLYHTAQA